VKWFFSLFSSPFASTSSARTAVQGSHNNYKMDTGYKINVNEMKGPFDGSKESFSLWTTQILDFGDTYNCEQAILGIAAFHQLALLCMKKMFKKKVIAC
jgi:hypothetical protein